MTSIATPPLPFKVKTVVSWAGEEDGDLGFMENEIVEVYSVVDESWWSGRLRRNNAEGIFPKDYVAILEDKLNHSMSSLSLQDSRTTPTKQYDNDYTGRKSAGTTPMGSYSRMKASYANDSIDYDAFENSFEQLHDDGRYGKPYTPTKNNVRSSKYMLSSMNHPKNKLTYQQQEELLRQKEKEIEYFKAMQQQQSYHVKPKVAAPVDNKRLSFQHTQSSPDVMGRNLHHQLEFSSPVSMKSPSYVDVTHASKPMFNVTIDTAFLPEEHTFTTTTPTKTPKKVSISKEHDILNEYEEIARRKAQLEMELERLKQVEKQATKMAEMRSPVHKDSYSIDSYATDASKKFSSKDDLSKKMSNYVTDEDEDIVRRNQRSPSPRDESPPPPPPPKHIKANFNYDEFNRSGNAKVPFDADDFRISTASQSKMDEDAYLKLSLRQEELKNSIKSLQSDVLNLSELSATSAGSFYRHKYEKGLQESQLKLSVNSKAEDDEAEKKSEVMEAVFQDKKTKHSIFQKLLRRNTDEINPIEKKIQQLTEIDWATFKQDINRMNSLTSHDKQNRTKRVVRQDGGLIIKPLDYISEINTNETVGTDEKLDLQNVQYSRVDAFVLNYDLSHDLNEFISDISTKFHYKVIDQVRGILTHLCKFEIIEEPSKILQVKPKLAEVQSAGKATIYQLNYIFKKILDALRIPCEVVLGFWKKPNEFYHNEQYVVNHCWLSVLVDNNFRIMDIYNFKTPSVCNLRQERTNEFYFLAEPLSVVSTHIPCIIDLQHVMPPIDPNIAFYLPRTYSGFYKSQLSFKNFNNALTRLHDLEVFELELSILDDIELFTLVKTSKVTSNELSLCQVKWVHHKRIAKIKAVLPDTESVGVLQIFAGAKGLQKHFDNIHELAIVIPLYHEGASKPTKFVQRFPTVQSQRNDLYITKPQTSKIIANNLYSFEIEQYPSTGLNSGSGLMSQDFKLVIESPSGKYLKLNKEDMSKPYGVYSLSVKCQETGMYRGLVIGDSGNSWYVFAQWECVQGTVTH
ncbi:Cytokinesis protein 3 [Candida viswanathii]|uniref:Cytokinesis protein 3 n=1 Tax=Candida viswanathii TaxID=5486 RepID=A0A367XRZ8_9ASCO|nr:Cytokinesis protein 3 [Candida viswanathii]